MHYNSTGFSISLNFADHLNRLPILIPVIALGASVSTFNIISITILLRSKVLRRPFNYPIINILLAATLQSFFTVPAYAFKRLDKDIPHQREAWICNIYRFPYFFCGDILRLSFMLVSFDRVIAVKCAYFYNDCIIKKLYITVITIIWTLVSIIDAIPFFPIGKDMDEDRCTYVTGHLWGICVAVAFNIIPFIITLVNFFIIWRVASKIAVKNHIVQKGISKMTEEESNHKAVQKLSAKAKYKKVIDIEISERYHIPNGGTVMNRKISYMYAVKDSNLSKHNLPEEEIGFDKTSSIDFATDTERPSCYRMSEKLSLILEMRATKTSVLLLLVYMLCWTPLGIYQFVENVCSSWVSGIKHEHAFIDQLVLKVLSLMSSVFLPLVYCWRTKLFRKEAQKLSTQLKATVKDIPLIYRNKFQKNT